jgi:hypothetical protein
MAEEFQKQVAALLATLDQTQKDFALTTNKIRQRRVTPWCKKRRAKVRQRNVDCDVWKGFWRKIRVVFDSLEPSNIPLTESIRGDL